MPCVCIEYRLSRQRLRSGQSAKAVGSIQHSTGRQTAQPCHRLDWCPDSADWSSCPCTTHWKTPAAAPRAGQHTTQQPAKSAALLEGPAQPPLTLSGWASSCACRLLLPSPRPGCLRPFRGSWGTSQTPGGTETHAVKAARYVRRAASAQGRVSES